MKTPDSRRPFPLTRRRFLRNSSKAAVAGPLILSSYFSTPALAKANNRIGLGFIGMGMMGRSHLSRFLKRDQVEVLAVCDVEQTRLSDAWNKVLEAYGERKRGGRYQGCAMLSDFREVLARRDIDAVVIATPDHWHGTRCVSSL